MKNYKFHVLSVIFINLTLMAIVFSTDHPLIIISALILSLIMLVVNKRNKSIIMGLRIFFPVAVITAIVNFLLVDAGSYVIFTAFNKSFTIETALYALIMSIKILTVIYLFYCIDCTVDSDSAVSFFSRKSPKLTLIFLLSMKLVPNMKERLNTLNDVYATRGVNFNAETKMGRIKANIPVLSILLSDSLDNAFDIGESAYVRGFLSGKRSEYERRHIHIYDYAVISYCLILVMFHIINIILNRITYDVYDLLTNIINFSCIAECIMICVLFIIYIIDSVREIR